MPKTMAKFLPRESGVGLSRYRVEFDLLLLGLLLKVFFAVLIADFYTYRF